MATKSKDVKNRPAGVNDKFDITAIDINSVIENGKDVLKAQNSARIPDLSTELTEGMSIRAYDGGKNKQTVEEER